ncbi:hypothetical protein [Roseicella aquatilis]|uniref:Uncharacterized protein n=1 Tax=Roseicella aquatilis TaxID=2527868 RepID=A0A4R4DEA0_9PROT|nr:hypothetical protein [Roseicella aquatilis]TCZ58685.1 hypothetical protein EXY23_15855 [Roseicella aquatilis]
MPRIEWLAAALGAAMIAAPALPQQGHASAAVVRSAASGDPAAWGEQAQDVLRRNRLGQTKELPERARTSLSRADLLLLAQGTGGGASGGAGGGLSSATPGSPAAGNLGSTPQELGGRSMQPAQGAATTLVPSTGRGAPDTSARPGTMQTAPGGTAVMPGDPARR